MNKNKKKYSLNENGKILCERDNREIKDSDIVEMRYDYNAENNMFWEPLRINNIKLNLNSLKTMFGIQFHCYRRFYKIMIKISDFDIIIMIKKKINII